MKADIHPDYHEITIVLTTGEKYLSHSTWGKAGDEMRLDIDPNNHPAWQGGVQRVVERGQLSKFEKRFGSFLTANADKTDEDKAASK